MNSLTYRQLAYLAGVPEKSRNILERAFSKEYGAGRGNAIRAKCLQCAMYDRRIIENCADDVCALHAYRPRFPRQAERVIDGHVFEGECFAVLPYSGEPE